LAKNTPLIRKKRTIVTIALILSIILYISGVYSGLYASRIIEEKTEKNIQDLKSETKTDIATLKSTTFDQLTIISDYVKFLDGYLKDMQLEQIFLDTLSEKETCEFLAITTDELQQQFQYYWDNLPVRLEQYERDNEITDDYKLLKQQYTQLSIRAWVLAKNRQKLCDDQVVPVIYFYSANCSVCVRQGEELDTLPNDVPDKEVMIFTIDYNANVAMVNYIKDFYEIKTVPAILMNSRVYKGRLFEKEELGEVI